MITAKRLLKLFGAPIVFCLIAAWMALAIPFNTFEAEAKVTQADIQAVKDKIAANEKKLADAKAKLSALSDDIENYLAICEQLQAKIAYQEGIIADTSELIARYDTLIANAETEIDERENEISRKYDSFLERLRLSYEEGTQSYIELLLSSDNLIDFLTRSDRLGSVLSYEQTLMTTLEREVTDLLAMKESLTATKQEQQELGTYQSATEEELKASLAEAQAQLAKLNADEEALKKVQQQASALDSKLDKELEDLLKKQQEEQKAEANAKLLWPVDSNIRIVTSDYGWRKLWGRDDYHIGIDIGAPGGRNIYAADGGTVIKATYNSSYGYYVLIDHGNTISTLYAHASKLLVSVGQKVERGQVIALVGTTGNSSGNHLHFEVRVNGQHTDPLAKNGNKKESWLVIENNGSYVDPVTKNLLSIHRD